MFLTYFITMTVIFTVCGFLVIKEGWFFAAVCVAMGIANVLCICNKNFNTGHGHTVIIWNTLWMFLNGCAMMHSIANGKKKKTSDYVVLAINITLTICGLILYF